MVVQVMYGQDHTKQQKEHTGIALTLISGGGSIGIGLIQLGTGTAQQEISIIIIAQHTRAIFQ
jgi:hypothetical protein